MKSLLLFAMLCITLSLTQCKDDESSPCTDNPAENLPWLKQRIQLYEQMQSDILVFQVQYELKTVFVIVPCCSLCNTVPSYYDCNGNELININYTSLGQQQLIWSLPTSDCGTYGTNP